MRDELLTAAALNVDYARRLVADIPQDKMAAQPIEGMNHAAWVLGHLAYVFDSMIAVWGQKPSMSPEWKALFQRHSTRFLLGSDTWVNERWASYPQTMGNYRRLLGELPPDVAEQIAWRNAAGLFGLSAR